MHGYSDGESFKSVIVGYLKELSKLTATARPFQVHLDYLWATLEPYLTDEDHDDWVKQTYSMDYKASMNKIRLISLILYRSGVLPKRDIRNRQYPVFVKGQRVGVKGGMTSHIKEDLAITEYLFWHMRLLALLTSKQQDATIHLDVMWFILTPYITQEDYDKWNENNDSFGNPKSNKYSHYRWNIEKNRIVMNVMNRADFLWKTTVIDAPEEFANGDGEINVRSQV